MADVSIDSSVSTSTARGLRSVVFTTASIGYWFCIDSTGTFGYRKTTDGGASWGAAVAISAQTTDIAFDVWFDQWTPGDSGTLIHTWCFDTGVDDLRYRTLDTSSDTLGTLRVVFAAASAVAGRGVFCSGTKTRSGYLYVATDVDAGSELTTCNLFRSTDGGTTWSANLSTTFVGATLDQCLLFPATGTGDNNDMWAIYHQAATDTLFAKLWDNSIPAVVITGDTITGIIENTVDLTGQMGFSASVRHSDGHIIIAVFTERDTVTADFKIYDLATVTSGLGNFTAKTNITTNIDDIFYPAVCIDQNTDDIYVAYQGKRDGLEVLGTTTKTYYTKSTDGGTSWSAGDTAYQEGATSANFQTWAPISGPRFYVGWRVGTTLVGNAVNSVSLAGPTTYPSSLTGSLSFVGADALRTFKTLTAGVLSFVGTFTKGLLYLRSFSATLFPTPGSFPTTNLVSYWKLDEASGTRNDSHGSNHLTDNNTVGSATGIQGNAASFVAASSEYLSCTSNSTLQMSSNTDFTIAAWMKRTALGDYQLITKDDDAANSRDYTIDSFTGSGLRFYIQGGGTYLVQTGFEGIIGQWYFVVAWYDSSNGQLHLRIDDTTTYNSSGTGATGTDVSAAQFRIGAREYAGFEGYASADIDEVGIWKRLLTAGEITALYNGGAGLTYTSSAPIGVLSVKPIKALAATLSFAAALTRRIVKALTATLSFSAALTKRIVDAGFTGALSFIGNLASSKLFVRALTGTLSFIGSLATQFTAGAELFFQSVSGTLSFVGAQTKRTSHRLTGTLSFIGALAKRIPRTFIGAVSFIGTLTKPLRKALTAALSFVGNLTKRSRKTITAILSLVGAISKRLPRTLTAALSFIGTFAKVPRKALVGAVSFIGAITRKTFHLLQSILSFVGNFQSLLSHIGENFLSLSANLSFVGALPRRTRHTFSSAVSFIGSLGRRIPQRLSGSLSFVGALTKRGGKRLTAALSFVGSLATTAAHAFSLGLNSTLSFIGALTPRQLFGRVFTATLNATGALTRRTAKVVASSVALAGALFRGMARSFAATLAFVGFLFRGGLTFFYGGQIAGSTLHIHVTGSTARIVRAGSELEIHRNLSGVHILVTGSTLQVERTT